MWGEKMKNKGLWIAVLWIGVLLCSVCLPVSASTEQSPPAEYDAYETYTQLEAFVTANPLRQAGSAGAASAKEWLKNRMISFGYAAEDFSEDSFFGYSENGGTLTYTNLTVKHRYDATKRTVVIGAHYDNASETGSTGALDNASGIAVLLSIAKTTVEKTYDFNVVFAFFDAEEAGLLGSERFVSALSQQEKDRILLYINLDTIACGEYLYVYGEDRPTSFERFFAQASHGLSTGVVKESPSNKRVTYSYYGLDGNLFYHVGQASDNSSFKKAGIPAVTFFSGNWESSLAGYVESSVAESVMHTPKDTIDTLKALYGIGFVYKTETVCNTVLTALQSEEFLTVAENARDEMIPDFWRNTLWRAGISLGLVAVVAAFAWLYYRKLKKDSYFGSADLPRRGWMKQPDAEDIFEFGGKDE